ncbi:MAG: GNAT family N-acetyltransferase, partial [Bacteroidota bacterium]
MALTYRFALPSDQATLEHWDQQPHIQAATGPDDDWDWATELPRRPPWREWLIFEWEHRPLGIVQIIDPKLEETHYWGEVEAHQR